MSPYKMLSRAQFHGANRLADPQHRSYWVIAMLIMLWCALSNLSQMVIRFMEAPTHLIRMDTVSTEMHFPSVLVCPEILFPEYKVKDFLSMAKYPKEMDAKSIRPIIGQLAAFFSPDVPYTFLELTKVQQFLEYNGLDVEEAGLLLTATCEETLLRCRFQWISMKCEQIFRMELTPYGFCCAFNGRSLKREIGLNIHKYAHYSDLLTSDVGIQFALALAVNQSQKMNNVDLTYKWVVVQTRHRYVDVAKNGTPLSPGSEQWTAFWTKRLFITEDLNFLSDNLRGCHLDGKGLDYFPVYNKRNCLIECQMRLTLQRCQCLLPFHYRPFGMPICQAISLPCARKALNVIFDKNNCDCPYTCEYEYEFSENFNYKMTADSNSYDTFYDGLDPSNVSVLRVFVKSHERISNLRRSYFSFHDLFSQLGGVFNVFFGCSILTLLELFQLGLHIIRSRSNIQPVKTLDPVTGKTKKKSYKTNAPFFNLCCRIKKKKIGRVKKPVVAKRITVVNLSKKEAHTYFIH